MRIAMMTIALRLPADRSRWIAVPPQGYAGIHWVVAHLVDGLVELGHEVFLLGAPGSPMTGPGLTVIDAADAADVYAWLRGADIDVLHDHSCGQLDPACLPPGLPTISTHHLTGPPTYPGNCVYLSQAHRVAAQSPDAPVVPISVNHARYRLRRDKEPYLLYLGRISEFKGTYEAAAFARASGLPLVAAGPSWEDEYRRRIEDDFPDTVTFVGEVGGSRRIDLLSRATAVTVLSQTVPGPWGHVWCEPGSTVVSEAAVSGTPVIATGNGCLPEIVPPVGVLVPEGASFTSAQAHQVLADLPAPDQVYAHALARWGHVESARRYCELYERVRAGHRWI